MLFCAPILHLLNAKTQFYRARGADVSPVADHQDASIPKLPLWRTICRAYSIYFDNFLDVLRASWLCIAVAVPLLMITQWIQLSWALKVAADIRRGLPPQMPFFPLSAPIGMTVLVYAAGSLALLAGVSIAVAWHRHIILGERPRLSGSNVATISFWRYVVVGLAIFLIAFVPLLILLLIAFLLLASFAAAGGPYHPPEFPILWFSLFLLLYLVAMVIMLRLILLLPARAAGNWSPTFRDSWNRTRGNTWRLFWGLVACIVPPGLLIQIVSLIIFAFNGVPGPARIGVPIDDVFVTRFTAIGAVLWAFYLLTTPIAVGFLSFSYLHFFERSRASGSEN
jgi:hypothetical protein